MDYKFNKDGTWIPATKEPWAWEAYYTDGTILKQFDDAGIFHQFKEIEQSRLNIFKMVHDTLPPYTLLFNPGKMKLIHFYKQSHLNIGASNEVHTTTYCFGYEINESGKTVKSMLMLLPSGETILTEDTGLVNFV